MPEESPLPSLDQIDKALKRTAGLLVDRGVTGRDALTEPLPLTVTGLLELRRHRLVQDCPTCKGKGMVSKYGDDERLTPYGNRSFEVPISCPNRAHHL